MARCALVMRVEATIIIVFVIFSMFLILFNRVSISRKVAYVRGRTAPLAAAARTLGTIFVANMVGWSVEKCRGRV